MVLPETEQEFEMNFKVFYKTLRMELRGSRRKSIIVDADSAQEAEFWAFDNLPNILTGGYYDTTIYEVESEEKPVE